MAQTEPTRCEPTPAPAATLIRSVAVWEVDADLPDRPPRLKTLWAAEGSARAARAHLSQAVVQSLQSGPQICTLQRAGADAICAAIPICNAAAVVAAAISLELALDPLQPAAVETWRADDPQAMALGLHQGWYSAAAMPMAHLSRHTRIAWGFGLPGLACQLGTPAYLSRLGMSELFVRAYSAMQIGLHHGLAIPATVGDAALLLLSGPQRPIARRVELAAVDTTGARCIGGFCQRQGDLGLDATVKPWGAALIEATSVSTTPRLVLRGSGNADHSLFAGNAADAVLIWPFGVGTDRPVVLSMWL